MEKHVLHETTDGTPQGGIISPALANCALDGLERLLREKYPAGKRLKSLGGEKPCVNLVRYADDFVITSKSKELLEGEIKPLVEHFLQERGLELSPKKTVITHVDDEQFPVGISAHVLSEEIKAVFHVRDDCLRRREFKTSFLQELLDEGFDLSCQ